MKLGKDGYSMLTRCREIVSCLNYIDISSKKFVNHKIYWIDKR